MISEIKLWHPRLTEKKRWWLFVETEIWYPFLKIMIYLHKNYDKLAENAKLKLLTPSSRSSYHLLPILWLLGYNNMAPRKKDDKYVRK